MQKPAETEITWLVGKENNRKSTIGFLRDKNGGAYIIGGPTGSHYTGHGESWELKWDEYIRKGYRDVATAKKNKLLPATWKAPKIVGKDKKIVENIMM